MDVLSTVQDRLDEASLDTARITHAMAIDGFDRVARGFAGIARALPAAVSPDPKLLARVVSGPAVLVDRQYALVGRLLGLHREFAQRLFDVLGARGANDTVGEITPVPANVVSLQRARKPR